MTDQGTSLVAGGQDGALGERDQEILAGVAAAVFETTDIPVDQVTPEASFRDTLDVDSLSMVEIATTLEDVFGIKLPDDALAGIKTVQDAIDYIRAATA